MTLYGWITVPMFVVLACANFYFFLVSPSTGYRMFGAAMVVFCIWRLFASLRTDRKIKTIDRARTRLQHNTKETIKDTIEVSKKVQKDMENLENAITTFLKESEEIEKKAKKKKTKKKL